MSGAGPRGGRTPPDFLAIVGCTGTGKTALSLLVARELDGEVISMDSRQVYRGMDIGTAKVTPRERALVPHHGLDIRDPGERYSAGDFGRDARRWIAEIRSRERVPLLVGGTGFFLRVLTDPIFREPPLDPARRAALEDALGALSRREMMRWVRVLDPERAEVAIAGGCQRMLRTLSVTLLTGRRISWWHVRHPTEGKSLVGVLCRKSISHEMLRRRIENRTREMVAAGFPDEVAGLLRAGHTADDPGMNGVGYREMAAHLAGGITLDEAVERTCRATRRYAKRQRTWFRHQLGPGVVEVDGAAPLEAQAATVVKAWRARTRCSVAHVAASTGIPAATANAEPAHP
ncbi:MAG: tRNA (adenosine(37)-N6)-dimethylallyltransferase MiaA [Gemmatimonadetes bacterium]|nr:tRNA (adenosine(37)-N6)-dimethylallyltransferase MiaA [Gemmatimonadota bacterium]MYA63768.1 tRNA (adenosine(37)-N6)-dimethylallyltransferase MiaA [Gemmatimonadota bacterium]MYB98797.1 tRNA (adenosine(37)-N6)-dimethylallyltransferase MiaA [Gemmatimonadota bacterium]MYH54253.1 tRNA (adenosine(37)-N6)-dimethylallyltransferase MiaA [Gemmatimonadota bacterium]MYI45516.1 tRNA (adenosine(37)-N6)-dimethylallyltransferase MiaA [Gemmatimonadota bacterium]